jgi:hypothetical protein
MHGYGFHIEPGIQPPAKIDLPDFSKEKAESLQAAYESELMQHFGTSPSRHHIEWHEFKKYAIAKESGQPYLLLLHPSGPAHLISTIELWSIFHDQLDLDGNGTLDARELDTALRNASKHLSTLSSYPTVLHGSRYTTNVYNDQGIYDLPYFQTRLPIHHLCRVQGLSPSLTTDDFPG